jgi:hypothetical protein
MGHTEIREYLKNRLLKGDESYYSVSQIRSHFIDHPNQYVSIKNISINITWLKGMGQLESKKVDGIYYYKFNKSALEQSSL